MANEKITIELDRTKVIQLSGLLTSFLHGIRTRPVNSDDELLVYLINAIDASWSISKKGKK